MQSIGKLKPLLAFSSKLQSKAIHSTCIRAFSQQIYSQLQNASSKVTTPTPPSNSSTSNRSNMNQNSSSNSNNGSSLPKQVPSHEHYCTSYNISNSLPLESIGDSLLQYLQQVQYRDVKILERGKRAVIFHFQPNQSVTENETNTAFSTVQEQLQGPSSAETASPEDKNLRKKVNPLKTSEANPIIYYNNEMFLILNSFGSVSFVNMNETEQLQIIQWLRAKHLTSSADLQHPIQREEMKIVVNENLKDWCRLGDNQLLVKTLNLYNINVISALLARSAALKNYELKVQTILETFTELNANIKQSSSLNMNLIPNIAQGNALRCDLLLNVRLFDRLQISWDWDDYDDLYDLLVTEFEISDRYELLEKKLNFIQENTQFYMELRHSKKSERAEWLIIILITMEVLLAIFHHYQFEQLEKAE